MNVPNRYKGFSQLPENVQQRMDPSLANKYQMGGSVMQRPLFRQMGGPTDMMPQDMMPPPPMGGAPMAPPMGGPQIDPAMEAQLMEAENMGAQTGEQIGAQFSQDMMMNLEGAEDYQSLIDGIRGNQLPIDARYQELAGYVGEQDAMATPESVLALTQPTIMMTEEGAMDSGIGELMQGIASDVPMQGPMDEGVGALMAAGAGNTPPVNFRNGGPVEVRGYSNGAAVSSGGGSRIMAQAERDVSDYENYLAGGFDQEARSAALEEQREMSKAQMLFDIAGTALNFAGQTQGNTIAERLANAASQTQLTDKIGTRSASILTAKQAQAAEERQLRMAARQASLSQAQADDTFRKNLELASAKKSATKDNQPLYEVDVNGALTGRATNYDLNDPIDEALYDAALKTGNFRDLQTAGTLLAALEKEIVPQELKQVQVKTAFKVDGIKYAAGELANLTTRQMQNNPNKFILFNTDLKTQPIFKKGESPKDVIIGLVDSADNLQKFFDLGWSTSPIDVETAAKKEIISFTQGFNKEAQARLFANQILLAEMSDTDNQAGRDLQEQIARDGRELQKTLQDNKQLFTTGRDQTLQGYKTALTSYGATIATELQNLKGQQGVEIEGLRAELRDQSAKVSSELNLANQLTVAKVKSVYEISKLTTASEINTELVKLKAALGDVSRADQNVFTAAESLLGRVATKENNVLSINARAALQENAQKFNLEENEKDRVLKAAESALARTASLNLQVGSQEHSAALQEARLEVQQSEGLSQIEAKALEGMLNRASRETLQLQGNEFDAIQSSLERDFKGTQAEKKALATLLQNLRSNALSEKGLDLQEARDLINGAATTSNAAVARERFELEKAEGPLMAAKGTAATLKYLSNQTALDAYANGTMSQTDANAMSATIEWWSSQGSEEFSPYANDGQGGYVRRQNVVPFAAKAAVAARRKKLGPDSVPNLDGTNLRFTKAGAPGSAAAYRFKVDALGNTVIDFDSFKDDPTLVITGGVDLTKSIGFGSGVNRFLSAFSEIAKDVTMGYFFKDTTKRAQVTRAGDKQLQGLGLTTLKVLRNDIDGRLFKLDMDKIEEEIAGFKPGAFGQDRAALAQLYMTRQMLAGQFKAIVEIANNATKYGKAKSTDASIARPKVEDLIGEFTAAIMMFEKSLDTSPSKDANTASNQVQSGGSITGNATRANTGETPP